MLPPQSAGQWRYRTRPIQCGKTHVCQCIVCYIGCFFHPNIKSTSRCLLSNLRPIHLNRPRWRHISSAVNAQRISGVVLSVLPSDQWLSCCMHKHQQFSEFRTLHHRYFPPVIHSRHSQLGIGAPEPGLSNALDLLVLSILQPDEWLWCCMHKHHQISEFETLWQRNWPQLICSHHGRPGIVDANSMLWISLCHPFCNRTSVCATANMNIASFRIVKIPAQYCCPLFDMSPLISVIPAASSWA